MQNCILQAALPANKKMNMSRTVVGFRSLCGFLMFWET